MNDDTSHHILSEDVANLLSHYEQGLDRYHEIGLQQAIEAIRQRWPLLSEIHAVQSKR